MDIRLEEGEATIEITAKPSEFKDLHEALTQWNSSSEHPHVTKLLAVIKKAGR